jgi:hypothetical protein
MWVIAGVGCCTSLLYAPGIDPALSAWELDCHASLTTPLQVSRHLGLSVSTRQ